MESYTLYMLTGAIFGALLAVVYQLKVVIKMDKKILSIEKKIETMLKDGSKKKKS